MIQKLAYTCRLCGANHVASYDDECPGLHLEAFLRLLVCNRCADYLTAKRKLSEAIAAVCRTLAVIGMSGRQVPPAVLDESRIKLERLTHQYAQAVCDYRHKQTTWEQSFVETLIEKPGSVGAVLREYERWMRKA